MNVQTIYNKYYTSEGIPFNLLSKRVNFPQDDKLEIYDYIYVQENIPWTILSYKLYGTINYWWVLSSLNPEMVFYAENGIAIKIIKTSQLDNVLNYA